MTISPCKSSQTAAAPSPPMAPYCLSNSASPNPISPQAAKSSTSSCSFSPAAGNALPTNTVLSSLALASASIASSPPAPTSSSSKLYLCNGPGQVDTVVADGSDPGLDGTTLSVTVKGPNSWEVVRKMKGRTLIRAHWTLSEDGKTLNDAFTQYLPDGTTLFSQPLPDGSTLFLPYVYERTAGNS